MFLLSYIVAEIAGSAPDLFLCLNLVVVDNIFF